MIQQLIAYFTREIVLKEWQVLLLCASGMFVGTIIFGSAWLGIKLQAKEKIWGRKKY